MDNPQIFNLHLRARPFEAFLTGSKKVEIRANRCQFTGQSVNLMRPGDTIIFEKEGTHERMGCIIESIALYPSVRELLLNEGTKEALSSTDDIDEGIKSIESIADYKEAIARNGVFAIRIKEVKRL